jgi:GT2 family glycosyltransferase
VEIEIHNQNQETLDYLSPHCAFFTFGENLGKPDCRVPVPEQFDFKPTRQPVILDFWEPHGRDDATMFTTIGNWRQPWREVKFQGETYRWSKHFEFHKFLDLPRRVQQPFELALASYNEEDQRLLESKGWRIRPALEFSQNLDAYCRYITGSRGEFTVAKDQNIRLRSGWFSDRAATYLAAGRPVITQDTGFCNVLPTGEGLFSFSTIDGIVAAVEAVNADYERHRRAALTIAREYFSHEVVLTRLLSVLGLSRTAPSNSGGERQLHSAKEPSPAMDLPIRDHSVPPLSPDLVIHPISRWPTRLPEETIQLASSLPAPAAARGQSAPGRRASIVIVTHQALPFTKLCVASLFSSGWNSNDELIIVDNASSDGTPDYLCELTRRNHFVRAVLNERNRGFAAANNQALALATGDILILLNGDTVVSPGWRDGLLRWLDDADVGMVGPVTNRTCNEAQIDAPYRTHGEFTHFATERAQKHSGVATEIPMLALFCAAVRRDVFAKVGPLDEQFEIGMFEDDDYALRIRAAGYRIVCAEDVFVHHFGQASLGELCTNGDYDRILEENRARFETKWGRKWQPHGRRITPEYQELRERIRQSAATHLPHGANVMVVSKGDEELLKLGESSGWHFPQVENGQYANRYPVDSAAAIEHLETLRTNGANYLLIPKPALWWLEHYVAFRQHLESRYRPVLRDEQTCLIFDLGGAHA